MANTIVITGASRGIGRALALALAGPGVDLFLAARDADALAEVATFARKRGANAEPLVLDVRDTEATVRALRAVDARAGGIDVVVANAGAGAASREAPPYAWETIEDAVRTSFVGAAATLTAVLPAMVERGRGHLVAMGSLASYGPLPGAASYCAPKAGVDMLLETLRLDLVGTGVAVTNVRLGFVRTRMIEKSTHPMPLTMSPDDVARAIAARLPDRPREIVMPRSLALAVRAMGLLPRPAKETIVRALGRRLG